MKTIPMHLFTIDARVWDFLAEAIRDYSSDVIAIQDTGIFIRDVDGDVVGIIKAEKGNETGR